MVCWAFCILITWVPPLVVRRPQGGSWGENRQLQEVHCRMMVDSL
jgi:hypothetical protein